MEIAGWPNRYFYGGELKNGSQKGDSVLCPLVLFDLKSNEEHEAFGGSIKNRNEAKFLAKLVGKIYKEQENAGLRGR